MRRKRFTWARFLDCSLFTWKKGQRGLGPLGVSSATDVPVRPSPLDRKVPVQIAGSQSNTAVKLDLLTFVDEGRPRRVADHVAMNRLKVREHCARFEFRLRKRVDECDGAPLCPSIDNFLKDVANAALRVAKCRPPAGTPQHQRLVHRGTGELRSHKSGLPLCLQLHHACEGSHKRMQRVVRSDNLRQSTAASLLLAGVNGLNRLNDANAGVKTCGHPLTHIEWDRKGVKTSSGCAGTRKPAPIGIEQVPNKIKKAITKDFANRLGQKLKTASDASARRTVDAANLDGALGLRSGEFKGEQALENAGLAREFHRPNDEHGIEVFACHADARSAGG